MFSITNYSLFIFTEVRIRILYVFFAFLFISSYSIFFLNEFLIYFLEPLELLNIDLNIKVLFKYFFLN